MKNSKFSIILLWMIVQLLVYELTIFGFLKSFQSDGISYYITLAIVFQLLYANYYYFLTTNLIIKVKSLFKPLFLSILFLSIVVVILSFLFPGTIKDAELQIFRNRLEKNGYSSDDVNQNMDLIKKLYIPIIFLGCFITHHLIGIVSLCIFKVVTLLKKKTVSGNSILM